MHGLERIRLGLAPYEGFAECMSAEEDAEELIPGCTELDDLSGSSLACPDWLVRSGKPSDQQDIDNAFMEWQGSAAPLLLPPNTACAPPFPAPQCHWAMIAPPPGDLGQATFELQPVPENEARHCVVPRELPYVLLEDYPSNRHAHPPPPAPPSVYASLQIPKEATMQPSGDSTGCHSMPVRPWFPAGSAGELPAPSRVQCSVRMADTFADAPVPPTAATPGAPNCSFVEEALDLVRYN